MRCQFPTFTQFQKKPCALERSAEDFHQDPAPTFDEFDQGGQTVPGTSCRGPFQVSSGDDSMMNSLGDETKAFTAWW